MFYDRLLEICKENNTKPTPVLKEIGCSSSNLKKWASGSSVNSDILVKLSYKFNVSIDYFLIDELTSLKEQNNVFDIQSNYNSINYDIQNDSIEKNSALRIAYNAVKAYPSNILNIVTGIKIHKKVLNIINKYLDGELSELLENKALLISDENYQYNYSPMCLIFIILSKAPGSNDYRYLQFLISRRIARNLFMKGITLNTLHEKKMCTPTAKKIYQSILGDKEIKDAPGFNLSEIVNISETFNISYDYMFTGKELNDSNAQ